MPQVSQPCKNAKRWKAGTFAVAMGTLFCVLTSCQVGMNSDMHRKVLFEAKHFECVLYTTVDSFASLLKTSECYRWSSCSSNYVSPDSAFAIRYHIEPNPDYTGTGVLAGDFATKVRLENNDKVSVTLVDHESNDNYSYIYYNGKGINGATTFFEGAANRKDYTFYVFAWIVEADSSKLVNQCAEILNGIQIEERSPANFPDSTAK